MTARPITRLAVCGWNNDTRDALTALEGTGAFRGVAIGDHAATALVRARQDTAYRLDPLPAFRQVPEMLRGIEYDAILAGDAEGFVEATTIAATSGRSVLLLADSARGSELESAADTAATHGVKLSVLQPARHDAGMDDLLRLVSDAAEWSPHYLDITVEAPAEVARLVSIAINHLVTLVDHVGRSGHVVGHHANTLVRGTTWADPARVVNATVIAHGRHATLHARHAPDAFIRIAGDAPAGAFELRIEGDSGSFIVVGGSTADRTARATATNGERLRYRVESRDHWTAEAARIADGADDTARARTEGAIRDALERSVATGDEQSAACCRRPSLRLLDSLVGETSSTEATRPSPAPRPGRRRLHLVGS